MLWGGADFPARGAATKDGAAVLKAKVENFRERSERKIFFGFQPFANLREHEF